MPDEALPKPKPEEFLALHEAAAKLFAVLGREFDVGTTYELNLHDVDCARDVLRQKKDIAAIAMRKLQALRFVSAPGVGTRNDVVVCLCSDLHQALIELSRALPKGENRRLLRDWGHRIAGAGRVVAMIHQGDVGELS